MPTLSLEQTNLRLKTLLVQTKMPPVMELLKHLHLKLKKRTIIHTKAKELNASNSKFGIWCKYHKCDTHNIKDCHALKKKDANKTTDQTAKPKNIVAKESIELETFTTKKSSKKKKVAPELECNSFDEEEEKEAPETSRKKALIVPSSIQTPPTCIGHIHVVKNIDVSPS
jgi:hypothetical protein